MKKILLIAILVSIFNFQFSTCRAQWQFGAKAGLGYATITDDLSTKSPILGATVGGFANLTFAKSQSMLAEIFYLQTGLNLNRRGSNFQVVMERDNTLSIREGYYHAYYAQIPILACVHMELPIRKAGHVVGFYLGPAINIGLFGRYGDRKVSPYSANYDANYDVDVNGTPADRAVFNHINRFDLSAIIGLSYEYRDFTVSLFLDHGFLATSEGTDVLRLIDNTMAEANINNSNKVNVNIPNGNNNAVMLSIAYRLGTVK